MRCSFVNNMKFFHSVHFHFISLLSIFREKIYIQITNCLSENFPTTIFVFSSSIFFFCLGKVSDAWDKTKEKTEDAWEGVKEVFKSKLNININFLRNKNILNNLRICFNFEFLFFSFFSFKFKMMMMKKKQLQEKDVMLLKEK